MLHDSKFWLAISFFIFVALIIKYALPKILAALDNKSKQIANDIEQAKQMRQKAEQLLLEAKKHHEESLLYCQKLISNAQKEADKLLLDSKKELEAELLKKTNLAKDRIQQEEEKTVREIKSNIIAAAIKIIADKSNNISAESSSALAKRAATDISKMIH
jgi:F-type H+-transporting ATPase subunit b